MWGRAIASRTKDLVARNTPAAASRIAAAHAQSRRRRIRCLGAGSCLVGDVSEIDVTPWWTLPLVLITGSNPPIRPCLIIRDSIEPKPRSILQNEMILIAHDQTTFLASQEPSPQGFLWLLLLMLFAAAMLLFVVAFMLSLLRIARRQFSRRRDRLEIPSRNASPDPWSTSSERMPLGDDGPKEPDPDQDLPPMGGRFR